MVEKVCTKCLEVKVLSEFRIVKSGKGKCIDGVDYYAWCKMCERELKRLPKNRISRYLSYDKNKGYDTDITEEWFISNILNKPCTYCGVRDSQVMTADRIDNSKGHLMSNCIPACRLCNTTRMDNFTVEEFKLIGPVIRSIIDVRV